MKAVLAFTLRAASLWQFALGKLLRGQKLLGAIFNRKATRRTKRKDALSKEKVTKKTGHPTCWFLLRKNSLPQAPRMARMQKLQDDPMDGGGRISSGMKSSNFLPRRF